MVRKVQKKQRNKIKRKIKNLIIVGLEGTNVTEAQYLNHFNSTCKNFRILFSRGNSTDPVGIVKDTIKTMRNSDFDMKIGDRSFCLIDTDFGKDREKRLLEALKLACANHIEILFSNPTFEIWFLLHFRYSTKRYNKNEEVILELKNYIPNYQKNLDMFIRIYPNTEYALVNAHKLEKYHDKNCTTHFMERSPSTKVDQLIRLVL